MSAQTIRMNGMTYEQSITLRNLVRVGQGNLYIPVTYKCASWAHPEVTLQRIGMKRRVNKFGILKEDIVGYTHTGEVIPSCDISMEAAAQIIHQMVKDCERHDPKDDKHVMDIMGFYIAHPKRMVMQVGKTSPRYFDLNLAREATDSEGRHLFPTPFDFACHCIFMESEMDVAPYEIFNF